jgi:epoxyqueuosine reductase QueG
MGASAIGYTTVTPHMIFAGMAIPHANVIVIVSEMERAVMDKAPHAEVLLEVGKTYATTTEIANTLTQRLRDEGFSAYSGIAIGGAVDHVRVAANANLGAIGYHGLLISPLSGTRLRINVLYTNITNLPVAQANDHEWVLDFCAMCTKCVRSCPPGAIKLDPPKDALGRASTLDNRKCADFMAANFTCSICMSVCPFSRAGYDTIKGRFKGAHVAHAHSPEEAI